MSRPMALEETAGTAALRLSPVSCSIHFNTTYICVWTFCSDAFWAPVYCGAPGMAKAIDGRC